LIYKKKNDNVFDCDWIGYLHAAKISSTDKGMPLGKVISVFDYTLNIKTNCNELLVVSMSKVRSPINLNILSVPDEDDSAAKGFKGIVQYGSEIKKENDNEIVVGGQISLQLTKSRVFKNYLRKRPSLACLMRFENATNKILHSLIKQSKRGCLLNPDITTRGVLHKFLTEIEKYRKIQDEKKFARLIATSLLQLCGRGPGFTPSGDDFISGYCVLFNYLSQSFGFTKLNPSDKGIVHLTTWISFMLMRYYERCVVDEQIQTMINSLADGNFENYVSSLVQISYRGHTSGIDIATGMTAALYTIIDRTTGTDLLKKLLAISPR
jgi:hypothetical protein